MGQGGGERVRSFVEDGELSAEALRVGGFGLSRGRDDAGQECLLVFLDHFGDAGQGAGCFDRGVVEGAAAEDAVVRLEGGCALGLPRGNRRRLACASQSADSTLTA